MQWYWGTKGNGNFLSLNSASFLEGLGMISLQISLSRGDKYDKYDKRYSLWNSISN